MSNYESRPTRCISALAMVVSLVLTACAEEGQESTLQLPAPVQRSSTQSAPAVAAKVSGQSENQPSVAGPEFPPDIVRAKFPDSKGKTFFNEEVLPKLTADGCTTCHMPGFGYVNPEMSYDGLFPFLAIGQAADNNVVIFKIANQRSFAPDQPNHPGGQRCATENAEPCKTIKSWWEIEFGG